MQAGLVVEDTPVGDVEVTVWAPADADGDEPLPMLMVHDGPEMATYGGLTHVGRRGASPPARCPGCGSRCSRPGARNERYSANPAYAAALDRPRAAGAAGGVPAAPTGRCSMGQSLGGAGGAARGVDAARGRSPA